MNSESFIQMAKAGKKPETSKAGEKSQEELRSVLEQRLKSLKPIIQEKIDEYQQSLEDHLFEDAEEEEEGAGEKRKIAMQEQITAILNRAESIKSKLDSKQELPQTTPEITATYKDPEGKTETITLDFEAKLGEFIDFYQETHLDLPPDFEDTTREIWERNQDEITKAIEENGFDDMLIIPPTTNLPDLAEKMKMGNGYYFFQVKEDFSDVQSQNVDKPRIILFHRKDTLPEIKEKTGLDIHLNITGEDARKLYQANPEQYLCTLEDALILERKYFKETGKHLSDYQNKSAHWLPASSVGARLVRSGWGPDGGELSVSADALADRIGGLGVRPSRCFF